MKKLFCIIFFLCFTFFVRSQVNLLYGPYLQQVGPTSAYICWRTDIPCNSVVCLGPSKTNLNQTATYFSNVVQHQVLLLSLTPNTKYYYTFGRTNQNLATDTFYFYTAPLQGTKQKVRVLAMGDCGTSFPEQVLVRDAVNNFVKNKYINCLLLLGDNAYDNGLDAEYASNFFTPYQDRFIFPNTCIYPTPGNHDYANSGPLQLSHNIDYFKIFTTPQNAELGGTASNHKEFYSYNYANIHFISLDSYGIESSSYRFYDTLGPQFTWLKQDLAANNQLWTVVYFHHPPYTMGSHNSDLESELIYTRWYVAQLLDRYGVDLVINGHSHNYERSWLMNGHYGLENTFSKPVHAVDSSSGKYDGSVNSCAYFKKGKGKGTIYAVAGTAGVSKAGQASFPHAAMYYSEQNKAGAFYFEILDNRMDAMYIGTDSTVHDKFTFLKNVNNTNSIYLNTAQNFTISASWSGNYNWVGQTNLTQNLMGTASSNTVFVVRDSLNCLADTFKLFPGTGITELSNDENFIVYPNPAKEFIKIKTKYVSLIKEIKMVDGSGNSFKMPYYLTDDGLTISTAHFSSGAYVLKIETISGIRTHKIIITK